MTISRRAFVRILSFSIAVILTLSAMLMISVTERDRLRRSLSAGYRRSYFELLSSMEAIGSSLAKASATASPETLAFLAGELRNNAATAEMRLCELPYAFTEDSQTVSFLNRVGGYASSLVSGTGRGELPQAETLLSLRDTADSILDALSAVSPYIYERAFFSELPAAQEFPEEAYSLSSGMRMLESDFPETPTLLYDGPYSEHLVGLSPEINFENKVTEEEAAGYAASIFGVPVSSLEKGGTVSGDIPCYLFTLRSGRSLSLLITECGGRLLGLHSSGSVGEALLNCPDAEKAALDFLSACGYSSLEASYHHTVGSVMYINFEAVEKDVLLYPDLIQIGVSLSDGEILSFDARGYLSNHKHRSFPTTCLSEDELASSVSSTLEITESRPVIIPTEGKYEIFCREFACRNGSGDRFLLYINCETGKEEKIMLLREDENGILAF